ncbi:uncharacterized protein LOC114245608 [Bombyx mandarina]|uniref:Uncharacterized protein LOC114245608 n=1 Tax=Bombyx mandarina TaxID=7092 RepID=A0A6J2JXT3_BOMMA|nr:uncharacterized protein LOC114245608 [Bombyx mandarina]
MFLINKELVVLVLTFIIADGKRWYTASTKIYQKIQHKPNHTDNIGSIVPQMLLTSNQSDINFNENVFEFRKRSNSIGAIPGMDYLKYFNSTNDLKRTQSGKISRNQNKRFLGVFQIVKFMHAPCNSSNGLTGTCVPQHECQTIGGTALGTCADGYGICCVSQFLCDENSAAVTGWFINSEFPSPSYERLSCTFTLHKFSEDIKQIRLDFHSFELLPPSGGVCLEDQFVVSGQNANDFIPIICGINTGKHVYIEVGEVDGPIFLSMQTVSQERRLFSIKVTQLRAGDDLAAPTGCLQYFEEAEGSFESFNYQDKSDIAISTRPGYFNNLNYAICIKRAAKACGITYTNVGDMQIVNYDTDGLPVIPPYQAGVEIFDCPSDWLLIAATRLCGDRLNDGSVLQDFSLNAPVTDTNAGPIVIWFRTDAGYVGRGFSLQYKQKPCMIDA